MNCSIHRLTQLSKVSDHSSCRSALSSLSSAALYSIGRLTNVDVETRVFVNAFLSEEWAKATSLSKNKLIDVSVIHKRKCWGVT